jgi:hypothetical protein
MRHTPNTGAATGAPTAADTGAPITAADTGAPITRRGGSTGAPTGEPTGGPRTTRAPITGTRTLVPIMGPTDIRTLIGVAIGVPTIDRWPDHMRVPTTGAADADDRQRADRPRHRGFALAMPVGSCIAAEDNP